jgi:hypothetical protein
MYHFQGKRRAICKTNSNDKLSFASFLTDINNKAAAETWQKQRVIGN